MEWKVVPWWWLLCFYWCLTGSAWGEWNRRYGRCAREERSNWRRCMFISFTSDILHNEKCSSLSSPLFSHPHLPPLSLFPSLLPSSPPSFSLSSPLFSLLASLLLSLFPSLNSPSSPPSFSLSSPLFIPPHLPPSLSLPLSSPLLTSLLSLFPSLHLPPSMHFSLCNLSCTYVLNTSTLSSSSPASLPLTYAHREMKVQLVHQDCQGLRGQPVSLWVTAATSVTCVTLLTVCVHLSTGRSGWEGRERRNGGSWTKRSHGLYLLYIISPFTILNTPPPFFLSPLSLLPIGLPYSHIKGLLGPKGKEGPLGRQGRPGISVSDMQMLHDLTW